MTGSPFAALLRERGATVADGRVAAVAAREVEHDALTSGRAALLVPLLAQTPLRLTGADRHDFLHGQVSNDVKGLPVGGTNRSLLLNHKGHALAGMTVCRRADDLYVSVDGGRGARVEDALRRHIIFDQVELENLSETLVTFTLQGAPAAEILRALGEPPADGRFVELPLASAAVLVHGARRSEPGGFDLHALARDMPALLERLERAGAVLAGEGALELSRVETGLPLAEREGGDGVLPQEAGLEGLVSYRKGCYLGQEIMARIEARGSLRRGLAGLQLDGPADLEAPVVTAQGRTVGRLGTVVVHPRFGHLALAVLRHDLDPDTELRVGEATARLRPFPAG